MLLICVTYSAYKCTNTRPHTHTHLNAQNGLFHPLCTLSDRVEERKRAEDTSEGKRMVRIGKQISGKQRWQAFPNTQNPRGHKVPDENGLGRTLTGRVTASLLTAVGIHSKCMHARAPDSDDSYSSAIAIHPQE